MSGLRLWLTLLFAATFQQGQAETLSNKGVLLKCNRSVEVEAGGTVTLTCNVTYDLDKPTDCKAETLTCNDPNISISDINGGNDTHAIMSVNISQVQKMGNYTFKVMTTCGGDDFTVQMNQLISKRGLTDEFWNVKKPEPEPESESEWESRIPAMMAVCFTITGVCIILCFLFGTRRGREIIRNMMTCNTQDDLSDTGSVVDKTPLNSEPQTP